MNPRTRARIPAALVYILLWLVLCCCGEHRNQVHAAKATTSFLRRALDHSRYLFAGNDNDSDGGGDTPGEPDVPPPGTGPAPAPAPPRPYTLLSSREIRDLLLQWADDYPTLLKLTTAQEAYGLPAAGTARDCTFDSQVNGCLNYIFTLQDFVTHPEGSESSNRLPEVLLSGEVHGDERVGPTAVMETASLLLLAASCVAYPRWEVKSNPTAWENDLALAVACRQRAWTEYGVDESQLQWLTRLVTTRRIVIVPTANALGYDRKVRAEGSMDPNRDFAFDQDPANCMRTIAGRTLNEVFREHMFQQSLTFHGGIELIGYEWGNADKISDPISPDDLAQSLISAAYSEFAGAFGSTPVYEYGAMNSILYPVNGGMEDWAYAGSWDSLVVQCQPGTFGGYPVEKTTYDDATLRAFNILIETSDAKTPSDNLGSSADILNPSGTRSGHVARNVRVTLMAIELVQPWLSIRQVNEVSLTEEVIPLQIDAVERESCQSTKRVRVPNDANIDNVLVEWKVGGAFTVDQASVFYALWDDIPAGMLDCLNQPSFEQLQSIMLEGTDLSRESGNTEFDPTSSDTGTFSAVLDLSMYNPNDIIVVLAMAKVDQDWVTVPSNAVPRLAPQSHMVNVRTNPDWHHEKDGKVLQGRLNWFSEPLTIEIGSSSQTETVEVSKRE